MIEEILKLFCCISSTEGKQDKDEDILYINGKTVKIIHNFIK